MISYAQNFEDVILWRVFKDVNCGRYVDVGAFHPEIDSVTKWFYDQGWSGINIEPVPESFDVLNAARPRDHNIRAAAGSQTGVAEMTVFPESRGLSSLCPPGGSNSNSQMARTLVQVNVLPLRQILEPYAAEAIHFLKIDAEGGERDVLIGMDFHRFRPWVVLVEATEPLTSVPASQQWKAILTANRYHQVYFDGLNEFFVAAEHEDLASRFQTPPNVFDEFELASTVRERQWRKEMETVLRADIAARVRDISALREETSLLRNELVVLRAQLTSSRAAVAKLSADVGELSEALKKSRETIETIFRSRSWRWLAPLRDFNARVRSYRKASRIAQLFR